MGLLLVKGTGVKTLLKKDHCAQYKHGLLSRSTGYPCKYTSPCWERVGVKMLLEMKLPTIFTSLFKSPITVMLVGLAAFTARLMGELKYLTVFPHIIHTA